MSRLIHDLCDWMQIPHAEARSRRLGRKQPPGVPVDTVTRDADAKSRDEVGRDPEERKEAG